MLRQITTVEAERDALVARFEDLTWDLASRSRTVQAAYAEGEDARAVITTEAEAVRQPAPAATEANDAAAAAAAATAAVAAQADPLETDLSRPCDAAAAAASRGAEGGGAAGPTEEVSEPAMAMQTAAIAHEVWFPDRVGAHDADSQVSTGVCPDVDAASFPSHPVAANLPPPEDKSAANVATGDLMTGTSQILDTPPGGAPTASVDGDISPAVSTTSAERTMGAPRTARVPVPAPLVAATETEGVASPTVAVYMGCFELGEDAVEGLREEYGDGDASLTPAVRATTRILPSSAAQFPGLTVVCVALECVSEIGVMVYSNP